MNTINYNIDMTEDSEWQFVSADPFSRENLIYLQESGLFNSGNKYYTVRNGLDSYLVKYSLSGQGILEYNGETVTVPSGSFFWIDCKNYQKYYTDPSVGHWKAIWVHFYGATSRSYYEAFLAQNHNSAVAGPDNSGIAAEQMLSILNFSKTYSSDIRCGIEASAKLTNLLSTLIQCAESSVEYAPNVILAIQQHIQDNYTENISLDDLSRHFSISKYHLQRQFKKYTGQSPSDYLTSLRLTRSKELLRTTRLPIADVAYTSGFNSVSYFIKLFHRVESVTPQQYRFRWSKKD